MGFLRSDFWLNNKLDLNKVLRKTASVPKRNEDMAKSEESKKKIFRERLLERL
jgi:hypothetical protein